MYLCALFNSKSAQYENMKLAYIDVCVHGTLFGARGFVVAETNQLHKDMSCAAYIFIVRSCLGAFLH